MTDSATPSAEPLVLVDRPEAHVALVTLIRPDRMNVMAFDVTLPLKPALDDLNHDNDVRVIVLTGAGRGSVRARITSPQGRSRTSTASPGRRSPCSRWKCSTT